MVLESSLLSLDELVYLLGLPATFAFDLFMIVIDGVDKILLLR